MMASERALLVFGFLFVVISGLLAAPLPAFAADKEKVLYRFAAYGYQDGSNPVGGVIFDAAGNLYGTTNLGGAACNSGGTVFELMPSADGKWTEKILHSFPCNTEDGSGPTGSLIFDAKGNLYSTTLGGGSYNSGTVFEMEPGTNGHWTERVLHSFGNGDDGAKPWSGVILDAAGNLYGTTNLGGAHKTNCSGDSCGTVFQLRPGRNGQWTEKVLHSFDNNGEDGFWPGAGLAIDAAGDLYGTAEGGHEGCRTNAGCGTVFELSPSASGKWTEKIINYFSGRNGANPDSNLIFDAAGNLYGTTVWGGRPECDDDYHVGCGTVFELMPDAYGNWTEKTVRHFYKAKAPGGGVIFDAAGNLYGTTTLGGRYWDGNGDCLESCGGIAFELSPGANGKWTKTTLHSFGSHHSILDDGNEPMGSLVFDAAGNLYGTTFLGGNQCAAGAGCGAVFEITP